MAEELTISPDRVEKLRKLSPEQLDQILSSAPTDIRSAIMNQVKPPKGPLEPPKPKSQFGEFFQGSLDTLKAFMPFGHFSEVSKNVGELLKQDKYGDAAKVLVSEGTRVGMPGVGLAVDHLIGMKEMGTKAKAAFQRGSPVEAAGYAGAAAMPMVGPWAASIGETAGGQVPTKENPNAEVVPPNPARAAGQLATGVAVGAALPRVVPPIVRGAEAMGAVARGVAKGASESARTGVNKGSIAASGLGELGLHYGGKALGVDVPFGTATAIVNTPGIVRGAIQGGKEAYKGFVPSATKAKNLAAGKARAEIRKGAPIPPPEVLPDATPNIEGAKATHAASMASRKAKNEAWLKAHPPTAKEQLATKTAEASKETPALPGEDIPELNAIAKALKFDKPYLQLDEAGKALVNKFYDPAKSPTAVKTGPIEPPKVASESPVSSKGPIEPPSVQAKPTSDISPSKEAAKPEVTETGPIKSPSEKIATDRAARQERLAPVLEKTPVGPETPFEPPAEVASDLKIVLGRTGSTQNQVYGAYRKARIIPSFLEKTGRWNEFVSAAEEVAKSNKLEGPEGLSKHKSNLDKLNQEYNLAHDYFTKANEHIADAAKKWDLPKSGFTQNSTRALMDKAHGTMRDILQRAPKEFRARVEAIEKMLGERPDQ